MPQYRAIYNQVVEQDPRYNLAENSPGFRAVVESSDRLSMLSGRALDVGCGVGFAVEYLSGPTFDFNVFGVDVSDVAIERARDRMSNIAGMNQRLFVMQDQQLPFEQNFFQLVTCFDVLEHLDEEDIDSLIEEMKRTLAPGGILFLSVSCRESGVIDLNGDNLHRTVQGTDWWIDKVRPDKAEFDGHRSQLALWWHSRRLEVPQDKSKAAMAAMQFAPSNPGDPELVRNAEPEVVPTSEPLDHHPRESASLYQKIYDDNPWYGNADQGRCPGVRLLPEYQDWLVGPVIDLGCGRGQVVEQLRQAGFEAEGIDQVKINPEMRVGDITKPIDDMERFNSAVCVDCIEHLYEDQVVGLFENMKRVKRQAFSIHNGESTGTGQELHVNRKSFIDWTKQIREHFEIASAIQIHENQILYLTQSKPEPSHAS